MDMHAQAGLDPPRRQNNEHLTFHWLYQRVQGLVDSSIYPKAGRVEKWSIRVGLAAAAFGVLTSLVPERWLPASVALTVFMVFLAVEILGFILGGILAVRREIRQYTQPRLSHAMQMDSEFAHWKSVIADLRAFPRAQREQRLRYVSNLRTDMIDRMGVMYGGLQRLGPFPLLVTLYLQFRGWKWGDWAAAFDVGWIGALLIFGMTLFYLLGWMLIGQRIRLDTYVALLEASIQEYETVQTPPSTPAAANKTSATSARPEAR